MSNADSLLVSPNLTKSDSTGPVPVGLLDTTSGLLGRRLASGLGGDYGYISMMTIAIKDKVQKKYAGGK